MKAKGATVMGYSRCLQYVHFGDDCSESDEEKVTVATIAKKLEKEKKKVHVRTTSRQLQK